MLFVALLAVLCGVTLSDVTYDANKAYFEEKLKTIDPARRTTPEETPVLTLDEVNEIKNTFKQPQCVLKRMSNRNVQPTDLEGRWYAYAMYLPGFNKLLYPQGTVIGSTMCDFYETEHDDTLIQKVISNITRPTVGPTCETMYTTWQQATVGDKRMYIHTVNYTTPQYVSFTNTQRNMRGKSRSIFTRILWSNKNVFVEYSCLTTKRDGTCPVDMTKIVFWTRQMNPIATADFKILKLISTYACVPASRLVKMDVPNDDCLNRFVNTNSMYYVPSTCDYTDKNFIRDHSTTVTYGDLLSNPAWHNVIGAVDSKVMHPEFDTTTNKIRMSVSTLDDNKCETKRAYTWSVNDTSINMWATDLNMSPDTPMTGDTTNFWRTTYDGLLTTIVGCKDQTCRTSDDTFVTVHRRYRKLEKMLTKVTVFPEIAKMCIEPETLPFVESTHTTCGIELDTKTCFLKDIPNFAERNIDTNRMTGTWTMYLTTTQQPYDSATCDCKPNTDDTPSFDCNCYYKTLGLCDGPTKMKISQSRVNPATFIQRTESLAYGILTMNYTTLYQTENMQLFYGCTHTNPMGTCRTDRTFVELWTKDRYTPTTDELNLINLKLDNVCVYMPTETVTMPIDSQCGPTY